MLLKVMADTRNIGVDFVAIRQAHARHLAQGRVRLLGRGGFDLRADAALLWRSLERRRRHFVTFLNARGTYELIYRRHGLNSTLAAPNSRDGAVIVVAAL